MGLRADTQVATVTGWCPISACGEKLTTVDRAFKMTLHPAHKGKGLCRSVPQTVVYSSGQPWILNNSTLTYFPKVGDVIECCSTDYGFDNRTWLAGVLFGIKHPGGPVKIPQRLSHLKGRVQSFATPWEDVVDTIPELKTAKAIGSFLSGWAQTIQREGDNESIRRIRNRDQDHVEWFAEYAPLGGYIITAAPIKDVKSGYMLGFKKGVELKGWHVSEIGGVSGKGEEFYKLSSAVTLKGGVRAIFR